MQKNVLNTRKMFSPDDWLSKTSINTGMSVGKINDKKYLKGCRAEIKKLKSIRIDNYCTLYDLLLKDVDEMANRVKNTVFKKIMLSPRIDSDFPCYGYLLKAQYHSGNKRRNCIDDAKEALADLVSEISFPDSCSENIFKYLSNADLDNLIEADEMGDDDSSVSDK